MICRICDCDTKMKCIYSVPGGPSITFRIYRCPECGVHKETVELPQSFFDGLELNLGEWRQISKALGEARARQQAVLRSILRAKKKKATTVS